MAIVSWPWTLWRDFTLCFPLLGFSRLRSHIRATLTSDRLTSIIITVRCVSTSRSQDYHSQNRSLVVRSPVYIYRCVQSYSQSFSVLLWRHCNTVPYVFPVLWRMVHVAHNCQHGRPHIGANGVSWPSGKMDEKLKSENMQKRSVFYVYVIFWGVGLGRQV